MNTTKPRVVKDFEKLDPRIQEQIKLSYPNGFSDYLIRFPNKEGKYVSALPFETEEKYYLVRMTQEEAAQIVEEDDDYGDDGTLKDIVKFEYEDKYGGSDETDQEEDIYHDKNDEDIEDDD